VEGKTGYFCLIDLAWSSERETVPCRMTTICQELGFFTIGFHSLLITALGGGRGPFALTEDDK
jgi:hypothetical protein